MHTGHTLACGHVAAGPIIPIQYPPPPISHFPFPTLNRSGAKLFPALAQFLRAKPEEQAERKQAMLDELKTVEAYLSEKVGTAACKQAVGGS